MFSHFLRLIKFLLTVLTNTMIVMLTDQVWLKILYIWFGLAFYLVFHGLQVRSLTGSFHLSSIRGEFLQNHWAKT